MRTSKALTGLTVRVATANDVGAMAEIETSAFSDPWPESAFHDLMRQTHARLTVAIDARGALVGYCVFLHGADEGEIANIAVAHSWRRRGVAAHLLDDVLAVAVSKQVESVYLEVRLSNDAARGLYESRGFAPVGRRQAYYREPMEDALVLRWQANSTV